MNIIFENLLIVYFPLHNTILSYLLLLLSRFIFCVTNIMDREKKRVPIHCFVSKELLKESENITLKPKLQSECLLSLRNVYVGNEVDRKYSKYFVSGNEVREITITIGDADCELDRGLENAVMTMAVGEESIMLLQQNRDETLEIKIFVKLIGINNNVLSLYEWSNVMMLSYCAKQKEKGSELFKENRIIDAFTKFSNAIKIVLFITPSNEDTDEQKEEKDKLYMNLCNNMAQCQLILDNYMYVVDLSSKVLSTNSENVKALMRRTSAYVKLKDFQKAREDVDAILKLEPSNCFGKRYLNIINGELLLQHKRYVSMVKQMFGEIK